MKQARKKTAKECPFEIKSEEVMKIRKKREAAKVARKKLSEISYYYKALDDKLAEEEKEEKDDEVRRHHHHDLGGRIVSVGRLIPSRMALSQSLALSGFLSKTAALSLSLVSPDFSQFLLIYPIFSRFLISEINLSCPDCKRPIFDTSSSDDDTEPSSSSFCHCNPDLCYGCFWQRHESQSGGVLTVAYYKSGGITHRGHKEIPEGEESTTEMSVRIPSLELTFSSQARKEERGE